MDHCSFFLVLLTSTDHPVNQPDWTLKESTLSNLPFLTPAWNLKFLGQMPLIEVLWECHLVTLSKICIRLCSSTYSKVPNNSAARLLIFKKFSLPTRLIWTYTLIKIQTIFLPTRLLSTKFYFFVYFQCFWQPFFIIIATVMHFFMHFHPYITF